jgi:hypothetical protein
MQPNARPVCKQALTAAAALLIKKRGANAEGEKRLLRWFY